MSEERRLPPLHAVTDDAVLGRADFVPAAERVLAEGGGGVALHLRGKVVPAARLAELALALRPAAERSGALLLVSDRVDVAMAAGADGVQLPGNGFGAGDARRLLGPARWVGVSVHAAEAPPAERAAGADFLLLGAIHPTASHPGRTGAGPGALRTLAGSTPLPVVAIGGVTPARVPELRAAGAAGVAAIRAVWDAERPAEAVRELLDAGGWR